MSCVVQQIYRGDDLTAFLQHFPAHSEKRYMPVVSAFFRRWYLIYEVQLPDKNATLRPVEKEPIQRLFLYNPTVKKTDSINVSPQHTLQRLHILITPEWVKNNSLSDLSCFRAEEPLLCRSLGRPEWHRLQKLLAEASAFNRSAYTSCFWELLLAFEAESRKQEV